ncbi:nucleoside kinase [Devosia epidermidihirudinis]|uniref:Nucleoside kinase n=1 Tax=Devosia epidermidihirudinis TaxID=1293439 RepID=A0A0F5QJ40_9HYPH|nr:AAA family ATPase [Devosia epidermidihirudinis]KKC41012.1 nucleoside kinase [Devosia epidermidihirudinis]
MGIQNVLIEGVSGTGKTTIAEELQRRGYHVVHGDRELAYRGDPLTGLPLPGPIPAGVPDPIAWVHEHHIWDIDKLKAHLADDHAPITFFCGGARNFPDFVDLFDTVFVLDVDRETLERRLALRPADEFGGNPAERDLIMQLHATKADIPSNAISIDATAPLALVVDTILSQCRPSAT